MNFIDSSPWLFPITGSLQHHIFDDYSNLVEKFVDFFRSAKVNDPRQSNQVVDTNWHRWGSNKQLSNCGSIALPTELPLTPTVKLLSISESQGQCVNPKSLWLENSDSLSIFGTYFLTICAAIEVVFTRKLPWPRNYYHLHSSKT